MKNIPSTLALALITSLQAVPAHAQDQQIQGNLEVLGGLSLQADAFMQGTVWLGKLPSTQSPGFKVDVSQATSQVQRQVVIPAHYEDQSVWVDDYGPVPNGTQTITVYDYGEVNQPNWVVEYGLVEETYMVDDIDIIGSHTVMVDDYGDVTTTTLVEATYDEQGNVLVPAHEETATSYGVTGSHEETIYDYGVVGSHPATRYVEGVTGGHYEDNMVWSIVGSHEEEQVVMTQGVIGSHEEVQSVWVNEQNTSSFETVYGLPIVRFTGQTNDLVWKWRNVEQELLELSPAGLSLPHKADNAGAYRAMLTSTQFEQSYTSPGSTTTPYVSQGTIMANEGIQVWKDTGATETVQVSREAKYHADEVLLTESQPSSENTTSSISRTTRIAATNAEFAGNVEVKGILRVNPAGDIGMSIYTNGPQP